MISEVQRYTFFEVQTALILLPSLSVLPTFPLSVSLTFMAALLWEMSIGLITDTHNISCSRMLTIVNVIKNMCVTLNVVQDKRFV